MVRGRYILKMEILKLMAIMFMIKWKEKVSLVLQNGDYLEGSFVNGIKQGKGKLFNKNGNIIYGGDFINDELGGIGKFFS